MQELNHIKNIVFDLGGVLIDLEPERTLKAFAELKKYSITLDNNSLTEKEEKGKSPISINDLIGGGESEWMQKYQVGKMTTEELPCGQVSCTRGAVSRALHLFQGFTH